MHVSQIQGCIVEQKVEKKRKIAESMWVHIVITVRTSKVAGQCAMFYTPRWPVWNVLAIQWVASGGMQWRRVEKCMDADRWRLLPVHSGRAEGDLYASKLRRTRWNLPNRDASKFATQVTQQLFIYPWNLGSGSLKVIGNGVIR